MGVSQDFEAKRLRHLADKHGLQTAGHLDQLLASDPKTKDDPALRDRWRRKLQAANPQLKD